MIELPEGRYLSCAFGVSPDAMGQTRALLMRNRFLACEAGVRPTVLAFGAAPDYERAAPGAARARPAERRRRRCSTSTTTTASTAGATRRRSRRAARPRRRAGWRRRSGRTATPWRIALPPAGRARCVYDYLRADGTPYLRIPQFGVAERASWRATIQPDRPRRRAGAASSGSVGQWFRRWIRELAPGTSAPSCSSTRASWSRTSFRSARAASTSSTRCTTCTWSRRGAGTRALHPGLPPRAARGSTTWTRSST